MRQHPISPPSEPMQYRAIGLVRGQYTASDDQFTCGTLSTTDGDTLDAVLLGRVMSLVKKHLDLSQEHLWVVYPRTRETEDQLHLQIVGVWEPERLQSDWVAIASAEDDTEDPGSEALLGDEDDSHTEAAEANCPDPDEAEPGLPILVPNSSVLQDGYFSIRGEVVYQSEERDSIVVKICQLPRKGDKAARSFKIKLKGAIAAKAIGQFWDFHAQRQANQLLIEAATYVGIVPPKKVAKHKRSSSPRPTSAKRPILKPKQAAATTASESAQVPSKPAPPRPVPRPVKRPNMVD